MAHHVAMKRRFGVGAAWVAATVVSILLASAAVATVRSEISERPSPLRNAALDQLAASTTGPPPTVAGGAPPATIASSTTTAAQTAQPTSSAPPTTAPSVTSTTSGSLPSPIGTGPSTTTTTIGSAPVTTTTTAPPVVTTTTTIPSSTSTTSTTFAQGEPQSYELTGGFVQIFVFPDSVVVSFATPKSGFSVDVKKAGPPAVEVRFEGEDHTSVFKADYEAGVLDVDITEQDKGGES